MRFSTDLSPEMAALAAQFANEGPAPDYTLMPPAEGRALTELYHQRWNQSPPDLAWRGDIWVEANQELGTPRLRVLALVPQNARPGQILFPHGGGFAFCSPETHANTGALLAIASGLTVLLPDYRLAPEHPYPAGLLDCIACLRAMHNLSVPGMIAGKTILAGDSAGANLALASMLHEQGAPSMHSVAGALLFYGVYAADFTTDSYSFFADGPGLTRGKMQRYWDWYAPTRDARRSALLSPVHADDAALLALPPVWLAAAAIDPLLSDTLNFSARLRALGRPDADIVLEPGVMHGFINLHPVLPAARRIVQEAARTAKEWAK